MLTMQSCRGSAGICWPKAEDGVIYAARHGTAGRRLSVSRAALYREQRAAKRGYLEVGESRLRVLNTSALEKLLYGV
ncbi:MAG: hypothetical protein ACLUI3_15735 [Christensenellales bacterium]